MAHFSRLSKIVIDARPADHDRELAFWSAAAGRPLTQFDRHPEYHGAALHGQEFWLLIQRLGEGQARVPGSVPALRIVVVERSGRFREHAEQQSCGIAHHLP